jgi:hypothetical protein
MYYLALAFSIALFINGMFCIIMYQNWFHVNKGVEEG